MLDERKGRSMTTSSLASLIAITALAVPAATEDRLLPWESLEETAQRTGYTVDELETWFPPLEIGFDLEGLAKDRFRPPPAPGVHPRIFFNPEDVPGLRRRIQETTVGRNTFAAMKETVIKELTGDKARYHTIYDSLSAGDPADFNVGDSTRLTLCMAQEAYRCLIEENDLDGRRVATAIATAAQIMREELARVNPTNDWQYTISPIVGRDGLARCYDLAHRWMTDDQRALVRQTLADATAGKWVIGLDALPAWEANMMNWIPWIGGELLVSVPGGPVAW